MLTADQIENLLKAHQVTSENAFLILQSICMLTNQSQGQNDSRVQALVLRALDRREDFQSCQEVLNGLVRHFGLFPYLSADALTVKDAIAREFHRPSVLASKPDDELDVMKAETEGLIFHRVQAKLFRHLLNGESIVLSAPTSFGKSSLIDALIESGRFGNVVIVVPTIALIDETRRRLTRFRETHKVLTHASQSQAERNIFVLTQERAIDFPELPDIDLFVLDEFYKLDPREDAQRAMTLNHAFYKLTKKAKQFYLLGPNIQDVPEGFSKRFKCQFIRTDFATVVTELISVNANQNNKYDKLLKLCFEVEGPTLIFCASPSGARRIVKALASALPEREGMVDAANWSGENYHPEWMLVQGLRHGIGMHHGRMPRALAQLCVKGFNEEKLPFLVCTSTLIEGVNTKAKNVIIFDNKIATKKYDFFTFNNIRGRSGRMFKHFIGNVYIFHAPPQEELPFVEVPVFSQDENNTSESLLIQLDESDLEDSSRKRLEPYQTQRVLSLEVLRQNTGIEPRDQLALARHLLNNSKEIEELAWTGFPTWERLLKLCDIIWGFFVKETRRVGGISSGKQLAFKIDQMRRGSLRSVIDKEIQSGKAADDAVENAFEFIRRWLQYDFPRLAMGVCRVQSAVAQQMQRLDLAADYSFYVGQVESLFSDPALIALDEYGLPFPLAQKLEQALVSKGSLDLALQNLSRLKTEGLDLTLFERALIEDVKLSL